LFASATRHVPCAHEPHDVTHLECLSLTRNADRYCVNR
jgi:hypothetical protein